MKKFGFVFFSLLYINSLRAQVPYQHDRVYTANQVSNTISVVDPSTDKFLGEINLGKPYPNVLSPLYKGQALVHGLRYCADRKMLAAIAIGSNSLTLISTVDNHILKTMYLGRAPHEPTFSPDNKQIWISIRGEAYISVIDVDSMKEIKKIPVADGPGMVSFSPDGNMAYVCSSFTPELDVIDARTYKIIKRIPVVSPFSPNIFTSPKGEWVAMTHKDVGRVTVIDTKSLTVDTVINTGPVTNHVSFGYFRSKLLMYVTVGGENKVRVFDAAGNFQQTDTVNVGASPHGIWPSPDGKQLYVGLEFGDQVQHIDLEFMKVVATIQIGQSPQALVYAENATNSGLTGLSKLNDTVATQFIVMKSTQVDKKGQGRLAVRSIGLIDLVEQMFGMLEPNTAYVLSLTRSDKAPYTSGYEINRFTTDSQGKYAGQSPGMVNKLNGQETDAYQHIILTNKNTKAVVLIN